MQRTILASALVLFLLTLGGGTNAEAKRPNRGPALIELGRRLFMDPAVSRNGRFSCADCHQPEQGFSDNRVVSEDENGKTKRHSQTLIDLVDNVGMHWDGEFDKVRELLVARLGSAEAAVSQANQLHKRHFTAASSRGEQPNESEYKRKLRVLTPPYYGPEMNRQRAAPRAVPVALRLQNGGYYAAGFRRAFGAKDITTENVIDAVEAYVLSIRSHTSRFDRFIDGDADALSASEERGFELFRGKADCASCHSGPGVDGRVAFTDNVYRNTGVAFKNVRMDFQEGFVADGGMGLMSFVEADLGKFKTPTLRDIANRAPYMHDGSLATLEDVVRYYDKGGTANAGLHKRVRPLHLTHDEVVDLVAFLKTLTSNVRPGLGDVAGHRAKRTRVRIVDVRGTPVRGLEVTVRPFGDRLKGAAVRGAPIQLRTDSRGWISFSFPLWTHVKLDSVSFELGEDRPLPDYVALATLIASRRTEVSLRVIAPRRTTMPSKITMWAAISSRKGGRQRLATFTRIRRLGRGEALYIASRTPILVPKPRVFGRHTVSLSFQPKGGANFLRQVDFSGGATETIDLRQGR